MRRILWGCAVFSWITTASAEYWIETGRGYQSIGGARRLGPYETCEQAEQVNNQYFNGQATITGYDSAPDSGGGGDYSGGYGGGTGDPAVDAMMPYIQQGFSQLGEAIARSLFGDPAEKARRAQEEAWRRAQAEAAQRAQQRFSEDMARKEAAEQAHLRAERHRKVLNRLKRLADGAVWDSPGAADPGVVDLRPGGNSFFGLGGEETAHNDPMVVDLRHLGRGASLARAAAQAPPADREVLMDEALREAQGKEGFLRVDDGAAPAIGEEGLLAFQKANAEYRKAHDSRYILTAKKQEAQGRYESAVASYRSAQAEYEKAVKEGKDPVEIERLRQAEEDTQWGARQAGDALGQSVSSVEISRTDEVVTRQRCIERLEVAAAPPSAEEESAWSQMEGRLDQAGEGVRKSADQAARAIRGEGPRFEEPKEWTQVHEGVILGTFTTQEQADKLMSGETSPFTGKSYQEMNRSEFWNQERRQGAMAVSFGTPEGDSNRVLKEAVRVGGDHLTIGETSLGTPQAQQAMEQLKGKEFDRLVAHSNGASIAEGLIRNDAIRVDELHVVGGDRSAANGQALQQLIDSGKVKRVVVWINEGDPIPWGTSADQAKPVERVGMLSERLARRASGELKGGDTEVQWMAMPGKVSHPQDKDFFGQHYLTDAYYPRMRKLYGTAAPASEP
jgi:hypothetical protein